MLVSSPRFNQYFEPVFCEIEIVRWNVSRTVLLFLREGFYPFEFYTPSRAPNICNKCSSYIVVYTFLVSLKYSSIIFKTIFFIFDINMIAVVGSYLRINLYFNLSRTRFRICFLEFLYRYCENRCRRINQNFPHFTET